LDWCRAGSEGRKPSAEEERARAKPGAPKGVIAISLSRIIAGGEIFLADSMADKSQLQKIIERELAANRWRWWTRIRFDQNPLATKRTLEWTTRQLLLFAEVHWHSSTPGARSHRLPIPTRRRTATLPLVLSLEHPLGDSSIRFSNTRYP